MTISTLSTFSNSPFVLLESSTWSLIPSSTWYDPNTALSSYKSKFLAFPFGFSSWYIGNMDRCHYSTYLKRANLPIIFVKDCDRHRPSACATNQLQFRLQICHRDWLVHPLLTGERGDVGGDEHGHNVPRHHLETLLAQRIIRHLGAKKLVKSQPEWAFFWKMVSIILLTFSNASVSWFGRGHRNEVSCVYFLCNRNSIKSATKLGIEWLMGRFPLSLTFGKLCEWEQ